MIHPKPSESLILVPVTQKVEGGSPPPIRVCPSSSWPTVPLCPPDAVSPKQQVELVHGKGLDFAMPARVKSISEKDLMMMASCRKISFCVCKAMNEVSCSLSSSCGFREEHECADDLMESYESSPSQSFHTDTTQAEHPRLKSWSSSHIGSSHEAGKAVLRRRRISSEKCLLPLLRHLSAFN